MISFPVAVLICVYNGDNKEHFIQSINSIKYNQIGIEPTAIRVYLHVDGYLDSDFENLVDSLDLYKVIKSKKNVGLAVGLNKLICSLEDEKYSFRMDSDDIASSDRFFKQIEFMERNRHIDYCGGSMSEFINSQDNVVSKRTYPLSREDIVYYMRKASPFSHVTICFRNSSLSKIGLYPINFKFNEDIALWNQTVNNDCYFENIIDNLCFVRMDTAYERRNFSKALSEFKVYLSISKRMKKIPFYPVLRLLFRLFPKSIVKVVYNSKARRLILK